MKGCAVTTAATRASSAEALCAAKGVPTSSRYLMKLATAFQARSKPLRLRGAYQALDSVCGSLSSCLGLKY